LGCYVLTTAVWVYGLFPFWYFIANGWSNCSTAAWMDSGASAGYNRTAVIEQLASSCAASLAAKLSDGFGADAYVCSTDICPSHVLTPHGAAQHGLVAFPFSDISSSSQYTATVEMFVCTMLIHAHVLLVWYTLVRLLLYGSPPLLRCALFWLLILQLLLVLHVNFH
jgi:hypothetical protein